MGWSALLYGAGGAALFVAILFAAKLFKRQYEERFYSADNEIAELQSDCIKYQNEDRTYRSLTEFIHSSANQYQHASIAHYVMGFGMTIILSIALAYAELKGQSSNYVFAAILPIAYIFTMAFHWSVKSDCFHKVLHKEASRLRHQHNASMQGK